MQLRFVIALGIALSCASCAAISYRSVDIDPSTGRFPTAVTIPDTEILQYAPTDISNLSIVYIETSTRDSLKAKQHEFMMTHVKKIGNWRVTDNLVEVAAACGVRSAGPFRFLGSMLSQPEIATQMHSCQLLQIEIHETIDPITPYRLRVIRYPGDRLVLSVSGDKVVWYDFDSEVLRPLLNVLKRWYDDSMAAGARKDN